MSSKFRVTVLGYGYWGPNLVRNFRGLEECEVVSVCDLSAERLGLLEKQHPGVKALSDWREAVRDPAADAVAIATPVSTHAEIAREAIGLGKHVLVEKPMVPSAAEARELVELAARHGRVLMVGHTFVYHGAVRKIRELYQGGELGEALYLDSTRANLGILQDDANVLWDLAPHDISILDSVVGREPEAVSATGASHTDRGLEDVAFITFFYPGGFVAHISVSWLSPVKIRMLLFGCTEKMVVYDDTAPSEKIKVYDRGLDRNGVPGRRHNEQIQFRAGDVFIPSLDLSEALGREVRDFAGAVREGRRPVTDGASGLRVVRLVELACRSIALGGAPIEVKG